MIVQAADRVIIDGVEGIQIIPLHRHGDMGKIFKAFGFEPGKGYRVLEEGFIDNHGHFYNRKAALRHVNECEQLGNFMMCDELYSEDLY